MAGKARLARGLGSGLAPRAWGRAQRPLSPKSGILKRGHEGVAVHLDPHTGKKKSDELLILKKFRHLSKKSRLLAWHTRHIRAPRAQLVENR